MLETYDAAVAEPQRATGVLRQASREARKLRSRERRALWDVVYDLIRYGDAYRHLGYPHALDGWLDTPSFDGLPFHLRAGCSEAHAKLIQASVDDVEAWLEASNRRAPTVLRANIARTTPEALQRRLAIDGIPTELRPPWGLVVPTRANLVGSQAFREGLFELQDHASQQICALIDQGPVLDLCAGAGGKSLALAAMGLKVDAWDVRRRALDELAKRAQRARTPITVLDQAPSGSYASVLVDAPCTGSGVWRRHPEYRWRLPQLDELNEVQRQVLAQGADLVAPGGTLVYATCSVLKAENEAIIATLDGWSVEQVLRLQPHHDDTDGMVATVLTHR